MANMCKDCLNTQLTLQMSILWPFSKYRFIFYAVPDRTIGYRASSRFSERIELDSADEEGMWFRLRCLRKGIMRRCALFSISPQRTRKSRTGCRKGVRSRTDERFTPAGRRLRGLFCGLSGRLAGPSRACRAGTRMTPARRCCRW